MIKLENVTKFYNSKGIITHALKNINLELYKNEFVAICGPSGSGKSTLLNVICKQDTFDEGEIYYKGNETAYFNVDDMDDFRKNKVGFIFQNYNIIESYTVLQNVMLPYELKGMPTKEAKKKALAIIDEVGLHDKINNRGAELSGGQKQRCVIARALAFEPEILACDEPTGNLDSETGAEIMALIAKIAHDKLVLVVTHNYEEVEPYATRELTIVDGFLYEDKILREVPRDEEKEVLNLDYVPIPKKINFKVALRNLINTPKKTIFSSLVIFFACFFMLSLYQFIDYIYNTEVTTSNEFHYKDENKYAICSKNEGITEEAINAIIRDNLPYIINPILESQRSVCYVYDGADKCGKIDAYFETYYTDYDPTVGKKPEGEDELYLLVPDMVSLKKYSSMVDKYVETRASKYKLVGIERTNKVDDIVICTSPQVYEKITLFSYEYKIYSKGKVLDYIRIEESKSEKNILYLPEYYKAKEIDEIRGSTGLSLCNKVIDFEVVYYDSDATSSMPYLELASVVADEIVQVSVYNADKGIKSRAESLGYIVLNTKKYDASNSLDRVINNLEAYGIMLLSSLIIIIIYFISYLVMIHIYKTKVYDFNIFRTLGVTKRDMRYITIFELLIQTIVIEIVVYVIAILIGAFSYAGNPLVIYKSVSLVASILYFVVMTIFGYLIARRFNKKLFKFSVAKTFKEVA